MVYETANPEQVFPQVEGLLRHLARQATLNWPSLFQDALSEAHWSFMRACGQFDPCRGAKLSTWIAFRVSMDLRRWRMRLAKEASILTSIPEDYDPPAKTKSDFPFDLIEELSEDAKEIVSLILESPGELAEEMTGRELLQAVRRYLMRQGWNAWRFERHRKEIKARWQKGLA